MHLADLVPDDPAGVDAVPVVVTLLAYQRIDVAIDLPQRHGFAHSGDDQRPVLGQVVHQLLEYPVGAEAAGVADVCHISVTYRRAVEDEGHCLGQPAGGGEELQRGPKMAKRGAVPEPRERRVKPVLNAPLDEVLAKPAGSLPLSDARLQALCHPLSCGVGQLL